MSSRRWKRVTGEARHFPEDNASSPVAILAALLNGLLEVFLRENRLREPQVLHIGWLLQKKWSAKFCKSIFQDNVERAGTIGIGYQPKP